MKWEELSPWSLGANFTVNSSLNFECYQIRSRTCFRSRWSGCLNKHLCSRNIKWTMDSCIRHRVPSDCISPPKFGKWGADFENLNSTSTSNWVAVWYVAIQNHLQGFCTYKDGRDWRNIRRDLYIAPFLLGSTLHSLFLSTAAFVSFDSTSYPNRNPDTFDGICRTSQHLFF